MTHHIANIANPGRIAHGIDGLIIETAGHRSYRERGTRARYDAYARSIRHVELAGTRLLKQNKTIPAVSTDTGIDIIGCGRGETSVSSYVVCDFSVT